MLLHPVRKDDRPWLCRKLEHSAIAHRTGSSCARGYTKEQRAVGAERSLTQPLKELSWQHDLVAAVHGRIGRGGHDEVSI